MASLSLSIEQQRDIERLLNTWIGKLTWKMVVDRINANLSITTTRQTLDKYDSVRRAYEEAKLRSRSQGMSLQEIAKYTKSDVTLIEQKMKLEADVDALEKKVNDQLMFIKAIYSEAGSNPSLMMLLQDLKRKLSNK